MGILKSVKNSQFKKKFFFSNWAALVAQMLKNLPAVQGTWVQSLGWDDPLEKEMANYSSIPTWEIP